MRTFDFPSLAERLLPAVLAAGALQMRLYEGTVAVESKDDSSPVTQADREAEAVLLDGLWSAARGVPVIAEESMALGQAPARGTTFFLVDPLDGTREFINRRSEFTINIGLVVGTAPVFGLIYAPALGELYVTLGERRAVMADIPVAGSVKSLAGVPFKALKTRAPDVAALTVLESYSHRTPETERFLEGYRVAEVKRAGSSLKFCRIARGDADFYVRLGPTKEWDTAAGQAVLEAAGGQVTTLAGERLSYGHTETAYLNPYFVAWGQAPIAPQPSAISSF
jgi:3'(2'), 5'-bisphosphate nucleotidase